MHAEPEGPSRSEAEEMDALKRLIQSIQDENPDLRDTLKDEDIARPPASPQEVVAVLGMGSWRLAPRMAQSFQRLIGIVEETWRQVR